nr:immunoglobulin heavy chain junction region [Macaca mulatta]
CALYEYGYGLDSW